MAHLSLVVDENIVACRYSLPADWRGGSDLHHGCLVERLRGGGGGGGGDESHDRHMRPSHTWKPVCSGQSSWSLSEPGIESTLESESLHSSATDDTRAKLGDSRLPNTRA